jgi:hypothetical protein
MEIVKFRFHFHLQKVLFADSFDLFYFLFLIEVLTNSWGFFFFFFFFFSEILKYKNI